MMSRTDRREIAYLTEMCEASAWADIYKAAPPDFARQYGVQLQLAGSASVLVLGALNTWLLNQVLGLGIAEPATEQMLDGIAATYKQAGVGFRVSLSPIAQPAALPEWLEARGMQLGDNNPKVYRGLAYSWPPPTGPAVPTDLKIVRIGQEYARPFGEVVCAGFAIPLFAAPWIAATVGRPGWRHYLAFDGDLPVASGALFTHNGVGWLGMAATLPSHHRRGGQGAIMVQRIQDAAELGCRWVTSETGADTPEHPNPSYHNMLRTDFQLLYMRPSYLSLTTN